MQKYGREAPERFGTLTEKNGLALELVWIWSELSGEIAQISAERLGVVTGDEVAVGFHGGFPLPIGIERGDSVSEWVYSYRLGRCS